MIKLNNISVSYKTRNSQQDVLYSVSLHIKKGESVAIVGKSGCGKTTLLSVLGGLLSPTTGSYKFENKNIYSSSDSCISRFRGESVGFIFQDFFLLPHLNVIENVLLPFQHSEKRDIPNEEMIAYSLLDRVGLKKYSSRYPNELSGGQIQRIAIARALVKSPKLILADEPTGNLDNKASESVVDLLMEVTNSERTIVVVTHDLNLAKKFTRQVNIIDGKVFA